MSEQKVTPDDMLRAARFLGPMPGRAATIGAIEWGRHRDRLAQEFASVRADERDACAGLCDEEERNHGDGGQGEAVAFFLAKKIRARGDA